MVSLRNFTLKDIPVLQKEPTYDKPEKELTEILQRWNKKAYEGRYFEMFAIVDGGKIKGTVSLYQHTSAAVSLGVEIFSAYQRQGYGFRGETLAIEQAKKLGYRIAAGHVRVDNAASIALQEKLGFERYHEMTNPQGIKMYFFIKSLV